jgi:hypothetical protein
MKYQTRSISRLASVLVVMLTMLSSFASAQSTPLATPSAS